MATSKVSALMRNVLSLLVADGYLLGDMNDFSKFAALLNGWAAGITNAPSFAKNDIGIVFTIPLYLRFFSGDMTTPRAQFVVWPTGDAAFRRFTEGETWTAWTKIGGGTA